jgi:hypothetical protein
MLELYLYSIALLRRGRYRVVRSTRSGDVLTHVGMDRMQLADYFRKGMVVSGTLEDVWKELDRAGIVEFSVME